MAKIEGEKCKTLIKSKTNKLEMNFKPNKHEFNEFQFIMKIKFKS